MALPPAVREWVSFEDPDEDRTWLVDVSFLASPWRCIFGQGCRGVLTTAAPELVEGCCSYGAHFTGEEDLARVEAAASRLTSEQWQHQAAGRRRGIVKRAGGTLTTRLVADACIFLNRVNFSGGPGCALHRAALEHGERPLDWKPDVCWQLPLRREDFTDAHGHVVSTLGSWERRHWGEGGQEFAWWCTESKDAFTASAPVYRTLADELIEMMGSPVYRLIADYLDGRSSALLPHPVLRRRGSGSKRPRPPVEAPGPNGAPRERRKR